MAARPRGARAAGGRAADRSAGAQGAQRIPRHQSRAATRDDRQPRDDRVPGRASLPSRRRGDASPRRARRRAALLRGARVGGPAPRQGLARRGGHPARRGASGLGASDPHRCMVARCPSTAGSSTPWSAASSRNSAWHDRPHLQLRTTRRRVRRRRAVAASLDARAERSRRATARPCAGRSGTRAALRRRPHRSGDRGVERTPPGAARRRSDVLRVGGTERGTGTVCRCRSSAPTSTPRRSRRVAARSCWPIPPTCPRGETGTLPGRPAPRDRRR